MVYPDYQSVEDDATRAKFAALWGHDRLDRSAG
jgi:predicted molibdopterin-dependent oxidoreductase YjgC